MILEAVKYWNTEIKSIEEAGECHKTRKGKTASNWIKWRQTKCWEHYGKVGNVYQKHKRKYHGREITISDGNVEKYEEGYKQESFSVKTRKNS